MVTKKNAIIGLGLSQFPYSKIMPGALMFPDYIFNT